jgi:hypothetical protein
MSGRPKPRGRARGARAAAGSAPARPAGRKTAWAPFILWTGRPGASPSQRGVCCVVAESVPATRPRHISRRWKPSSPPLPPWSHDTGSHCAASRPRPRRCLRGDAIVLIRQNSSYSLDSVYAPRTRRAQNPPCGSYERAEVHCWCWEPLECARVHQRSNPYQSARRVW